MRFWYVALSGEVSQVTVPADSRTRHHCCAAVEYAGAASSLSTPLMKVKA